MDWKKELKETNWPLVIFEILILILMFYVVLHEGQLEPMKPTIQYVIALGVVFLMGKNLLTIRRKKQ
ncbi:hypothetical protein LCGC14_0968420 [marine sediment metagenome]|uniref:Uncharacterized protein n=1 Tax=marine sediment metagenome TaxID=412755 RepID=A0A0F9NYH8_9ZZZZ